MKIGVLTSSRADYGIYQSLLMGLSHDATFDLHIIVFGMHVMPKFGNTIEHIRTDNYGQLHELGGLLETDDTVSIAQSYAQVCNVFANFYNQNEFDVVIALGDRYEMNAAVQAGVPYNIKFAHLHAGETTLGAIDNIYRHQISLASDILFTSTEEYKVEAAKYTKSPNEIYNVGALSLDAFEELKFDKEDFFKEKFNIPNEKYVLITFHPETIRADENVKFAQEMYDALYKISSNIHLVITMPNADTAGSVYRAQLEKLKKTIPTQVSLIENFGKRHYFNAMHYAQFLLGNTSSGIIEAASFGKYVVNVGDRQKGRSQSDNVMNCNFTSSEIIQTVQTAARKGDYEGNNVYCKSNVSEQIINTIKEYFEKL
jgi:GDP/UDP-N,N'-diacetylbacillosamine 2-epimerase (hydrolysing)